MTTAIMDIDFCAEHWKSKNLEEPFLTAGVSLPPRHGFC